VNDLWEDGFDLNNIDIEEQKKALELYENNRNNLRPNSDDEASITYGNNCNLFT
jgi:hypothetical protein